MLVQIDPRLAKLREGGISVDEYIDAFVYTAEQVKQTLVNRTKTELSFQL
jgi:hypothetical protein